MISACTHAKQASRDAPKSRTPRARGGVQHSRQRQLTRSTTIDCGSTASKASLRGTLKRSSRSSTRCARKRQAINVGEQEKRGWWARRWRGSAWLPADARLPDLTAWPPSNTNRRLGRCNLTSVRPCLTLLCPPMSHLRFRASIEALEAIAEVRWERGLNGTRQGGRSRLPVALTPWSLLTATPPTRFCLSSSASVARHCETRRLALFGLNKSPLVAA